MYSMDSIYMKNARVGNVQEVGYVWFRGENMQGIGA